MFEQLGQGHYAVVHRAQHVHTGGMYALKKIAIFDMDSKSRKECLNEASLLQRLQHPNIVRLFDSFMEENDLYLVLELADGGDLHRTIAAYREQGRQFEELEIWRFMYQLVIALQHMHANRTMHRDIKPTNCFLTAAGELKLGDLGLGRVLSSKSAKAQSIVGTPCVRVAKFACFRHASNSARSLSTLSASRFDFIPTLDRAPATTCRPR